MINRSIEVPPEHLFPPDEWRAVESRWTTEFAACAETGKHLHVRSSRLVSFEHRHVVAVSCDITVDRDAHELARRCRVTLDRIVVDGFDSLATAQRRDVHRFWDRGDPLDVVIRGDRHTLDTTTALEPDVPRTEQP